MSDLIEFLTPEQEALLPVYKECWTKIALDTSPADRKKAEECINRAYDQGGKKRPLRIVWFKSPKEANTAINVMKEVYNRSEKEFKKLLLSKDFYEYISSRGGGSSFTPNSNLNNNTYEAGYGSFDASWLAFYNYFLEVLNVEACNKIKPLMDLAKVCGWWYPYDMCAVATEKPEIINLRGTQLHCETGPAIRYRDGFEVYSLNGVVVDKTIVMTPANELSVSLVLSEKNAEVRREIVRKIGIDKIVTDLGAVVLDQYKDYELLNINLGDGRVRPYLRMVNPSIGATHVEGVHPDCKTVKEALAWRNGLKIFTAPSILT